MSKKLYFNAATINIVSLKARGSLLCNAQGIMNRSRLIITNSYKVKRPNGKELKKEVHIALEILLEEIEAVFNQVNEEEAKAFERGDHQRVREAAEMAECLVAFHEKVKGRQEEWTQVFAPVLPSEPERRSRRRRDRLSRGLRMPEHAFRRPILEALVELGGRASVKDVLDLVGQKMEHKLNKHDYGRLPTGEIRWRNTAKWCCYEMIREGLLKDDSPRGIWEISDKGRQALETGKV